MTGARPKILDAVAALGHAVFVTGDHNLNVIGVRSPVRVAGRFDDRLYVAYTAGGAWLVRDWSITTDPGSYYLRQPLKVDGTAIMLPGQYSGAYVVGAHKGYPALVQDRPIRFVRDGNRDGVLDLSGPSFAGVIGANIHASDLDPFDRLDFERRGEVGRWSAACQVFERSGDYRAWWALVQTAVPVWGPRFTYTLCDESALRGAGWTP